MIWKGLLIEKKDFKNMEVLAPLGFMAYNFRYVILPHGSEENKNYGELCLIGPSVGLGYYNDSEKKSMIINGIKRVNNFPWSRTYYKTKDVIINS